MARDESEVCVLQGVFGGERGGTGGAIFMKLQGK